MGRESARTNFLLRHSHCRHEADGAVAPVIKADNDGLGHGLISVFCYRGLGISDFAHRYLNSGLKECLLRFDSRIVAAEDKQLSTKRARQSTASTVRFKHILLGNV